MNATAVLEAITPLRIGGAEVFVTELCLRLPAMGARVDLFVPAGRSFGEYAAKRGLTSVGWKTYGKLDPRTVIRLARLMKARRIDVLHTHLSTASLLGAYSARLAKRPAVAHVHGLNSARCFRRSTHIIAVSEAAKRHLCMQGIRAEKVSVVHNGVDLERFTPVDLSQAKREQGFDPDAPVFGVFGRLSPEKGQTSAIAAMGTLLQDHPRARLVVAGEGRDWQQLTAQSSALGLAENVIFSGFVQDVRALMSACDAVIVPSRKEGFGLAAVEAMALGRPVVASQVGGLPEIVNPGETGFLVEPDNVEALALTLGSLVEERDVAVRMGAQARARAEEHFDINKQMHKVLETLQGKC